MTQELYYIRGNFNYQIDILIESYDNNSIILNKKNDNLNNKVKKTPFDSDDFMSTIIEQIRLENDFKPLVINSIFIMSFSLFEIVLKKTCDLLNRSNPKVLTLNDIKGNGEIDKFRKYLFKVQSIEKANPNTLQWKKILAFKNIRNAIIHNHNKLQNTSKKNYKSTKEFMLLNDYQIKFEEEELSFKIYDKSFLEDFKANCNDFIQMIYFDILSNN